MSCPPSSAALFSSWTLRPMASLWSQSISYFVSVSCCLLLFPTLYSLPKPPAFSWHVWSTARHRHAPKGSNRSTSLPDLIPYLTSTTKLLVKYLWVFKILSLLKRTTVQSSLSFTLKIGKKPQSPASSPSKLSVKRFAKPRCVSPFPELSVIVAQAPTCWEF